MRTTAEGDGQVPSPRQPPSRPGVGKRRWSPKDQSDEQVFAGQIEPVRAVIDGSQSVDAALQFGVVMESQSGTEPQPA